MDPRFPVDEDVLKQKNLFDSALCYSERSPTPRSASQFWISAYLIFWLREVFACEYLRENKSFSKTILACSSGGLVSFKNAKKSHDTATSGKIALISSKKKINISETKQKLARLTQIDET